jgi:branched-chain amino acid transport system substrate-binding protein
MSRLAKLAIAAAVLGMAAGAQAQTTPDTIRVGVLADMSSLYADLGGPGSVEAAKMAVEDFGGSVLGKKVEVVSADHQNKPDVGSSIARQWFDQQNVQMIRFDHLERCARSAGGGAREEQDHYDHRRGLIGFDR